MSQRERNWDAFDWEDIVPRLLLYARVQIRRKWWRGQVNGPVPGGLEAEDFVYGAIEKLSGGRESGTQEKA